MTAHQTKGIDVDVSKLFDQAVEMYEASLKAGVKAQRDAAKFMSEAVEDIYKPVDFEAQSRKFMDEVMPTAQKNFDEVVKLMNKNANACVDLMRRAFDAGECKTAEDAQAKARALWEDSVKAMQANAEAMVDANAKMLQSWADLAKKNTPKA